MLSDSMLELMTKGLHWLDDGVNSMNDDYLMGPVHLKVRDFKKNSSNQSHKKRSSDKKIFFHFHTPFYKIGGVLFWRGDIFSPKIG